MEALIDQIAASTGAEDRARLERIFHAVCAAAPEVFRIVTAPDLIGDDPQVPELIAALPGLRAVEAAGQYFERCGFDEVLFRAVEAIASNVDLAPRVRAEAARSIIRSRAPALMNGMIHALWSEVASVRHGAARGLALAKEPNAVRPLLRLIAHGDRADGAIAIWAVGEIGLHDPWAERVLVDAMRADHCGEEAIEAIGKIAGPIAIKELLLVARRRHTLPAVKATARIVERYLGYMETEHTHRGHVALLLPLLRHQDEAVRIIAAVCLLRLGHRVERAQLPF